LDVVHEVGTSLQHHLSAKNPLSPHPTRAQPAPGGLALSSDSDPIHPTRSADTHIEITPSFHTKQQRENVASFFFIILTNEVSA
jgi:hypothetical protein